MSRVVPDYQHLARAEYQHKGAIQMKEEGQKKIGTRECGSVVEY